MRRWRLVLSAVTTEGRFLAWLRRPAPDAPRRSFVRWFGSRERRLEPTGKDHLPSITDLIIPLQPSRGRGPDPGPGLAGGLSG